VAVLLAVLAALLFGISAVADQRSTKRVRHRKAGSPWIFVDLVRQPLWLTAIAANVAGFLLQIFALKFGSLAVVQPLLVADLVFAVLISWLLARRSGQTMITQIPAPLMFTGVFLTFGGVAGFLAVAKPSAGTTHISNSIVAPLALGLVALLGACMLVAQRSRRLRPLALALACGVNYGVAAFVVKLVTSETSGGAAKVFTSWPIYALAIVGPAGFLLNQDALQEGTYLAPVQAIITTADPLISIALAILWLNVRVASSPAAIAGQVIFLVVMTAGIVITAHAAPQCQPKMGQKLRQAADVPPAASF
jgi:hypothetical protein